MIYVLCGIPASGKTTLAKYLSEKFNAKIHSWDDIDGANSNPDSINTTRAKWIENIKKDLDIGNNVICDGMNILSEKRVCLINEFKNYNCPKILYVMTTPLEECIKRNAQRIGQARLPNFVLEQSQEIYEPPSYSEGWDEIYMVNWR